MTFYSRGKATNYIYLAFKTTYVQSYIPYIKLENNRKKGFRDIDLKKKLTIMIKFCLEIRKDYKEAQNNIRLLR